MAEKIIKIINFEHGMFQYFIVFDFPLESKIHTKLLKPVQKYSKQQYQSNSIANCKEKSQKRVTFAEKTDIKMMYAWQFAYNQARRDKWQQAARDRGRFEKRIYDTGKIIEPVLENKFLISLYSLNI